MIVQVTAVHRVWSECDELQLLHPSPAKRIRLTPQEAASTGGEPMRTLRIEAERQLRLGLSKLEFVWPEQLWDSMPEEAHREALSRLGDLLRRWLDDQESRP